MRLSHRDFCRLTPEQLDATAQAYTDRETRQYRGEWERTRTLAALTIQPHVSKQIAPKDLIRFPWEEEEEREEKHISREEAKKRYEQLKQALSHGKAEHD